MQTEFANGEQRGSTAFEGLARHAGVPLATVVEYAEQGRLGELVERRSYTRPLSGADAHRRINEKRSAPGTKPPRSPHAALGELRARRLIWDCEAAELRRRDPHVRLAELRRRWGSE